MRMSITLASFLIGMMNRPAAMTTKTMMEARFLDASSRLRGRGMRCSVEVMHEGRRHRRVSYVSSTA